MQGGWQPPPGGAGYGAPPAVGGAGGAGGGGYGQPPGGAPPGYGAPPPGAAFGPHPNPYGTPGINPNAYGSYEFNDLENSVIHKTGGRARLWGIISITVGGLQCVSSCGAFASPGLATNLPSGIVAIVVGIAFLGVGTSLTQVVQTQGNDLAHMMQALEKMGGAFMVQIICAIVGFLLTILAFVIVAFVMVAAAAAS